MSACVIIPTLDPDTEMVRTCVGRVVSTTPTETELVLLHDKERNGFANACNRGAKEPQVADLLVFLNDDTIPQPGWLDALCSVAEDHEIVGARLSYPDGSLQHTGVTFRRDRGVLVAENRRIEAESGPVPAVTGACMAIRRDTFDLLGGFDESFINGYEDVDLCLRAKTGLGVTSWYCAESNVVHLESQSEGRFDHVRSNIDLLQRRWGWLPT